MVKKEQQNSQEYTAGPIDRMIVSILQSMDRGSF